MEISYSVFYDLLNDCLTRLRLANLGIILVVALIDLVRLRVENVKYYTSLSGFTGLLVIPMLIPSVLFGNSLMGLLVTTLLFGFAFVIATFFEIKQLFKQQLARLEKRITFLEVEAKH